MVAQVLQRMFSTLLAATLLSSQLFASMPGRCGCVRSSDAVDEVKSCCSRPISSDSDVPRCCASAHEGNSCCCDDECGKTLIGCNCGCGKSNGDNAPSQGNDRLRIGYAAVPELASTSLRLVLQDSCANSCRLDSPCIHRLSLQILFCVWQK